MIFFKLTMINMANARQFLLIIAIASSSIPSSLTANSAGIDKGQLTTQTDIHIKFCKMFSKQPDESCLKSVADVLNKHTFKTIAFLNYASICATKFHLSLNESLRLLNIFVAGMWDVENLVELLNGVPQEHVQVVSPYLKELRQFLTYGEWQTFRLNYEEHSAELLITFGKFLTVEPLALDAYRVQITSGQITCALSEFILIWYSVYPGKKVHDNPIDIRTTFATSVCTDPKKTCKWSIAHLLELQLYLQSLLASRDTDLKDNVKQLIINGCQIFENNFYNNRKITNIIHLMLTPNDPHGNLLPLYKELFENRNYELISLYDITKTFLSNVYQSIINDKTCVEKLVQESRYSLIHTGSLEFAKTIMLFNNDNRSCIKFIENVTEIRSVYSYDKKSYKLIYALHLNAKLFDLKATDVANLGRPPRVPHGIVDESEAKRTINRIVRNRKIIRRESQLDEKIAKLMDTLDILYITLSGRARYEGHENPSAVEAVREEQLSKYASTKQQINDVIGEIENAMNTEINSRKKEFLTEINNLIEFQMQNSNVRGDDDPPKTDLRQ